MPGGSLMSVVLTFQAALVVISTVMCLPVQICAVPISFGILSDACKYFIHVHAMCTIFICVCKSLDMWRLCAFLTCTDFTSATCRNDPNISNFPKDLHLLGHNVWRLPRGAVPDGRGQLDFLQSLRPLWRSFWKNPSGWWLTYSSEKYERQIGMIISNIWKNKKCSKPPTSHQIDRNQCLKRFLKLYIPVVPHKAVSEVPR